MHKLEEKACPKLVQISNSRGLCCDTYYPKVGSILHRTYTRSKGSRQHRFQNIFLSLCVCSEFVSNLILLIFIRKCSPISSITNALLAGGLQVTPMLFVTHIEKEKGLYSGSSNQTLGTLLIKLHHNLTLEAQSKVPDWRKKSTLEWDCPW